MLPERGSHGTLGRRRARTGIQTKVRQQRPDPEVKVAEFPASPPPPPPERKLKRELRRKPRRESALTAVLSQKEEQSNF
ncbi:Hypothetical predicted protein [Lynx pardinus]|uniref:Uncharacterized protein n=1 Tax=Lynx pardinus TaxID=191816 RepID=A0A485NPB4_LYNPA|nr:Hypothetical predicted protein [Lynx pardinus]